MTKISAVSPAPSAVARCTRRTEGFGAVGEAVVFDEEAGEFVEVEVAEGDFPEIAAAGCIERNQCKPTATECAQIFPHCRESRQVQRFSMSDALLITSPERYEFASACTTPLSTGAVQFELSTLSVASSARASFIASHPAAVANRDSLSCSSDMVKTV